MPKTISRSSEASVNVLPDPSNVVGFPLSEKKAKIIRDAYGNFRVVVRRYYWDSAAQRGKEKREYLGYVVDNVYYATEDYRRHFHRDGTERCAPKKPLSSKGKGKNMTADLTDPSTQTFLSSLSSMGSGRRQQDPGHRFSLDAHEFEFRLSLQVVGERKTLAVLGLNGIEGDDGVL